MHDLALVFMIMYLIYYRCIYRKNNIIHFNKVLGIICGVSTLLRFITIPLWDITLPLCRAISTISFAMLFCQIPKLVNKKSLVLFATILLLVLNVLAQIAPITDNFLWIMQFRYAFAYAIFTPFLYFACQLPFSFKPLDYLGKISGPIYYYQGVNYLFLTPLCFFDNIYFLLFLPMGLAILDDGIRRLIKYKKRNVVKTIQPFEYSERFSIPFEQKKWKLWIVHSITILCITAYLAIFAITSLSMYLTKAPNWESWWWLNPDGEGMNFSTFGKIGLLCLSGVFIPLFFSLNISLVVKGRKKYPLDNPSIYKNI